MDRKCENCGKDFKTPPSQVRLRGGKYCSRKCYDESRHHTSICVFCGKTYNLGREHHASKERKYCSNLCRISDTKKISFECFYCKKIFFDSPSRKRIFCGKDCQRRYRTIRPKPINKEKECDNCGIKFIIKYDRQRFCSRDCSSYWLSNVRNKGENHPKYKGNIKQRYSYPSIFYKIRKDIIKIHNGECLICGNPASSVHHIDYDKENNYIDNLVLLCNRCHAKTNTNREEWKERINHLIGCW